MPYIGPIPNRTITASDLSSTILTGQTDIGANIADADLILVDDGAGGTIRKSAASRIKTYIGAPDSESAYTGVLETNANFIDQVIFGPAVDGMAWKGYWSKASLFSSVMLATIEDPGSNAQLNIWDLTEQSAGTISTTPLATVDLSGVGTPTCVSAIMGYVFIGSEDGFAVVDPHDGAWAERTDGWPKTTSTSTRPTLAVNTILDIGLGYQANPPYDPRTGGYLPSVGIAYDGGTYNLGIIKYGTTGEDPTHYWRNFGQGKNAKISNNTLFINGGNVIYASPLIDTIVANSPNLSTVNISNSSPHGLNADTDFDIQGNIAASADEAGLTLGQINFSNDLYNSDITRSANAIVTRAYNTGFMCGDIKGVWLASTSGDSDNEGEKDRTYHANNMTQNGTPTEAAVASGAELDGYSGFSSSVNYTAASNAEWDVFGTGSFYCSIWFKCSGNSATEQLCGFTNAGNSVQFYIQLLSSGVLDPQFNGATATASGTATTEAWDDNEWHKVDCVQVSSTERYVYVDGVLKKKDTTDIGSISDDGNLPFGIGAAGDGSTQPATTTTLALCKLSATPPHYKQIREMYEAEKGMFEANAECHLQSGSTDAVLDVSVDPLSKKVLVTQTDAITIFDGCVIDSKPTVNSGNSERGKLWGDLRTEQNSANVYVTAPANDQRQINEMVRSLSAKLPNDTDLSKAKAWAVYDSANVTMESGYNIKSITDRGTGAHTINFATPFKNGSYVCLGSSRGAALVETVTFTNTANTAGSAYVYVVRGDNGAYIDSGEVFVVFFGELENE